MDLGIKRNSPEVALMPAPEQKDRIDYPTVTIEKKLADYEVGDEFTATVKFRVRAISEGAEYGGDDPERHRCTLEMISMDQPKMKGKGLPGAGGAY